MRAPRTRCMARAVAIVAGAACWRLSQRGGPDV